MRPVQLELTNFGPYRKEVINFTQFDHAPLFLIGGDTGAGKSTLFDAMTVALFATTSGDRNVEEMRSNFAGLEDDLTKVTFYFQQGNHLYRIERVLSRREASEEVERPYKRQRLLLSLWIRLVVKKSKSSGIKSRK